MEIVLSLLILALSGPLVAQNVAPAASLRQQNPAATAGASNIAPRSDLSGTAISACGSITSPGNYYLSKDLSCPGTALFVSGPGINLNLNGHTIIYGTAGGPLKSAFGIDNYRCSIPGLVPPCDDKGAGIGIEIYDGKIVQSTHAPDFSHAFYFGSNLNVVYPIDVHDVTITVQQTGSKAFSTSYQQGQLRFEHNTIYDNVASINLPGQSDLDARSLFQGQAVTVDGPATILGPPDQIDNNKIVGSPQGGIRDTSTGALIYENDISQNATYANDFCVDIPGTAQQVYRNYCHPVSGRGLHVNGEQSHIYNNLTIVTEKANDREYGGCEFGGAYGIQAEDDIQAVGGTLITGNLTVLNTGACGGGAFRITGWPAGISATVKDNIWIVNKTPGAESNPQYPISGYPYFLDADDLSDFTFGGDLLLTNSQACVGIDYDGAVNLQSPLFGCTAPYAVDSENGNDPGGIDNSTFTVTNAPNTNLLCGSLATTQGTINGKAVKCPK